MGIVMESITVECISDNHGYLPKLQGADLLLHSGDWSSGRGSLSETEAFLAWLGGQPHACKVAISGNHDFPAFHFEQIVRGLAKKYGVVYLRDEATIFEGFKIWGSPWQPWFYDWAWNFPKSDNGRAAKLCWDQIPEDTDILLTHGPPHGIGDEVRDYAGVHHTGCPWLTRAIERVKPQLQVNGHIHQGAGSVLYFETLCVNASILDEQYKPYATLPPIITLTKEDQQVDS